MGLIQRVGARFTLFTVNGLCILLSCLLIGYGTVAFIKMGRDQTVGHVTNAFALVISMGSIMLVVSLAGFLGACCAGKQRFNDDGTMEVPGKWKALSNRLLYVYFAVIMLTISSLIYGMMLCFIWAEKANDYVDAYLDILKQVLGESVEPTTLKKLMKDNAKAAGVICLFMIFVNFLCVHCCAVLMGYKYTARKSVMWINGFGFIIGISVMIIAFMPDTQEVGVHNSWLPGFIGFLGILLVIFAIVGFYASSRLKAGLLLFNTCSLAVVALLLFGFAIFCLSDSKDAGELVKKELPTIVERFVDVCPHCCHKVSSDAGDKTCSKAGFKINANSTTCCENDVIDISVEDGQKKFSECCEHEAGLFVWHNLSLLGVTCTVAFLAILLNLAGSYVLYRRIKKDDEVDLDRGELDGLEDGIPREGMASRAQKYRTQEPDDGL